MVWTLCYLSCLTVTAKDVHSKSFKKILPAVFLLQLKTRLCLDLCTPPTWSDLDLSKYDFET